MVTGPQESEENVYLLRKQTGRSTIVLQIVIAELHPRGPRHLTRQPSPQISQTLLS
jgi:hypothetical protein